MLTSRKAFLAFFALCQPILSQASGPTITKVVNAASFESTVAIGTLIAIFGSNLASCTDTASVLPYPSRMCQVSASVLLDNKEIPLYYVSPSQVNAYIPIETVPGSASLQVRTGSQTSASFKVTLLAYAPALFKYGDFTAIQKHPTYTVIDFGNPARNNDIVIAWLTGGGGIVKEEGAVKYISPLALCLDKRPQEFIYSVKSTLPGVDQAAARLMNITTGIYEVSLSLDNCATTTALLELPALGDAIDPKTSPYLTGRFLGASKTSRVLSVNGVPLTVNTAASGRFISAYPK